MVRFLRRQETEAMWAGGSEKFHDKSYRKPVRQCVPVKNAASSIFFLFLSLAVVIKNVHCVQLVPKQYDSG